MKKLKSNLQHNLWIATNNKQENFSSPYTLSSMSTADSFAKLHTEAALSLFCKITDEVMQEQGVKGAPSCAELHRLIMSKVFSDEENSSSLENVPREDDVKEIEEMGKKTVQDPQVEVEVEVQPDAPKPSSILTSKDLKKNPLKIQKKELNEGAEVEVEVEIVIPYLAAVDYSATCQSLKVNGGLFTPCLTRPAKGSDFCKTCAKGNHKYGTIKDRSACSMLCYEDPNGKKEISFGTYIKKRGVERAEVESKILEQYGVTLPEEYWSIDKTKASRVVKTVSTSSDDEASVDGEKPASKKSSPKKRGAKKASADKSVEPVEETKSVEPDEETKSVEPVEETKSVEPVEETKSVEPVEETKSVEPMKLELKEEEPIGDGPDESSVEGGVTPAPKKSSPKKSAPKKSAPKKSAPKKSAPKKSAPKKSGAKKASADKSVESVEETKSVKPVEETKSVKPVEETKSVEPMKPELTEEPISDTEDESPKRIEKKNGSLLKLDADKFQVFWNDATYIIDMEDNSVWTHDGELDIITCVGEWNPETKEVEMDEE